MARFVQKVEDCDRLLRAMSVKSVMTPRPTCVEPDAPLAEAAKLMADLDVGILLVCENERLAGAVTDRDITIRGTARGLDNNLATVREVMTPEVIYCFEDQSLEDTCVIMERNQLRRLPVLDRQKRLVGIVSLGDVANRARSEVLAGEALGAVSAPAPGGR